MQVIWLKTLISIVSGLVICYLLLSSKAFACDIKVFQAYVRATPPGVNTAAAYLTLGNFADQKCVLVGVISNRAKQVMIHQNQLQGDMMHMRHLSQLEILGRSRFTFKPGGHHLMLSGLSEALREGQQLTLKLQFESGQVLVVRLPVLAVGQEPDDMLNY